MRDKSTCQLADKLKKSLNRECFVNRRQPLKLVPLDIEGVWDLGLYRKGWQRGFEMYEANMTKE